METPVWRIPYKFGDKFTLKPLFDVHYGARACDVRGFKRFLKESDDKTYFLGGGDLFDAIVVKDPRYQKSSDATGGDDILDQPVDEMVDILMPYKDRILGLGIGNHEAAVLKHAGTNLVNRVIKRLNSHGADIKYLDISGLGKIKFSENKSRTRSVKIRWHHGWGGGGRTEGGSLTKYAKDVKFYVCDVAVYGHDHKTLTYSIERFDIRSERLVSKPIHIGLCGTFLKTFLKGSTTYSENAGYPPVSVGGIQFTIKPTRTGVEIKGSKA